MFEISLIICTKNREEMIADVFKSAAKQSLDSLKYEVIIIDDSTNDKTRKLAENYPDFIYMQNNSSGLAASRNTGLELSKGKILVFIDDDVIFNENYLQNILEFFNNSEFKPDFVGGRTHIKFLAQKPDWIEGSLLGMLAYSDYGNEPKFYDEHPKHCPYGCNMAVKRECLDKIGGFSSSDCSLENEDIILADKLKKSGYNLVYCPQMEIQHKMPASRLTYLYYKKRYYEQGKSDALTYYLLEKYSSKSIPVKIFLHLKRLLEGMILQHFKKEKHYQKLRVYYNWGYINSLVRILFL